MKIRHSDSHEEKIELQMTPMIDIVFQLLVFFILTFKIVVQEGDFNVKMPLASADETTSMEFTPPVTVKLTADANGNISDIVINEVESFGTDYASLTDYIKEYIGVSTGSEFGEDTEVEFDCDYNIRYEEVIKAITAVSGYRDPNTGEVITLVKKINFKDQPPVE